MSSAPLPEVVAPASSGSAIVRVDRFLANYVSDPMLWPVMLAVLGHVIIVIAPVILLAVRDRHPLGIVGLAFALVSSASLFVRRGRPRARVLGWLVLATWVASAGMAWLGYVYRVL